MQGISCGPELRPTALLALCALWIAALAPLMAGEPRTPETPWTGPNSPFKFEDGEAGARLVKIGNESYQIITLAKLAADPNPGLTHRNVAVISDLAGSDDKEKDRRWQVWLSENPKNKLTHPDRLYDEGSLMLKGLRIPDPVLVLGTAQADGNGSTLLVTKIYRIPSEVSRLTAEVAILQDKKDYEADKAMADALAGKIATYRNNNDINNADKLTDLRGQVVNELMTVRFAFLRANQLSLENENEFMKAAMHYLPNDIDPAAEICKHTLKRDPKNKMAIEAAKALLPNWVLCGEANAWMDKADCDKIRNDEIARREHERQVAHDKYLADINNLAGMSAERHFALLQNQTLLADAGFKLPAATDKAWEDLTGVLKDSHDYRLVQALLLQCVTELDRAEWARLIPAVLANPDREIRLLGFRLGGFSNDKNTIRWLAEVLVEDKSDSLREDAVLAMCESRTPQVVQGLVHCMERDHNDDHLNQVLQAQLQLLTHHKEPDLAGWLKYADISTNIEIVPE